MENLYSLLKLKTYIIYCYKNNLPAKIDQNAKEVKYEIVGSQSDYNDVAYTYKDFIIIYRIYKYTGKKLIDNLEEENFYPKPFYIEGDKKNAINITADQSIANENIAIDIVTAILDTENCVVECMTKDVCKELVKSLNVKTPTVGKDIFYKLFYHPVYNPDVYGYIFYHSSNSSGIVKDYRFRIIVE